jgi:hypothetical protein
MEIYKMMKHLIAALMSAPFCFSAFAQTNTLSPEEIKQSIAYECIIDKNFMGKFAGLISQSESTYIQSKLGRLSEQATTFARVSGSNRSVYSWSRILIPDPYKATKESIAQAEGRIREQLAKKKTYCISYINDNGL